MECCRRSGRTGGGGTSSRPRRRRRCLLLPTSSSTARRCTSVVPSIYLRGIASNALHVSMLLLASIVTIMTGYVTAAADGGTAMTFLDVDEVLSSNDDTLYNDDNHLHEKYDINDTTNSAPTTPVFVTMEYTNDTSEFQQVILAIVPKITSAMSILGSSWIILEVARDKKKQSLVYHRILLSMSIADVLYSVAKFMSTWPIPTEALYVWGNVGNVTTCDVQGFFIQLGLLSALYNGCLCYHFLLVIKYNWREEHLKKLEWPMHVGVLAFSFGTAFASLFMRLFNNDVLWCWISQVPLDCSDNPSACTRGKRAWIFIWPFFYIPIWIIIISVSIAMTVVYRTVYLQERTMKTHQISRQSRSKRHKNSRKVANQGMLYVLSFFLTWIIPTVERLLHTFNKKDVFAILLLNAIFSPLQGCFNFLVYIRPRYQKYRREHSSSSPTTVMVRTLRRAVTFRREEQLDDDDFKLGTIEEEEARRRSQRFRRRSTRTPVPESERVTHLVDGVGAGAENGPIAQEGETCPRFFPRAKKKMVQIEEQKEEEGEEDERVKRSSSQKTFPQETEHASNHHCDVRDDGSEM